MPNQKTNRFEFWPFCTVAAVFGTVASQSVLDVFTFLMFGRIVYDFFQDRKKTLNHFRLLGVEWAFAGYFLVVVLGFLVNASPEAEIQRSLLKFSWVLNLYIYIYALSQLKLTPKKVIVFFSLAFLIPNVYAIASYLAGADLLTRAENDRVVGFVDSATYHAHGNGLLLVFFAACLYFFFAGMNTKLKGFSLSALLLFFLSVFFTFTRGIWLSVFLSTALTFLKVNFRRGLLFVALVFMLSVAGYHFWPQFRERVNHSFDLQANHERADLFMVNYAIWREYPVLGIGYGENLRRNREYWDRLMMPRRYITSHAHNQYLNVLATTGICGLFFFLFIFIFFFKKSWLLLRSVSGDPGTGLRPALILACFLAQLEFYLGCFTDVSFEYAKIRALLLFVWALIIVLERKTAENEF